MIQEFGPGTVFRVLAYAKPRPVTTDNLQHLGLELVNINVYAFFFQNIPHRSRDRASFIFFSIQTSAKPRPMANDICRSLRLDIININVYTFVFQNTPYGSIVMVIFANCLQTDTQFHKLTTLGHRSSDGRHYGHVLMGTFLWARFLHFLEWASL